MSKEYWRKQTIDNPTFPELSWSRPENKLHAGKLLIVGGNAYGFKAPAESYAAAQQAGAGSTRIVLPNAIQKVVTAFIPEADFTQSTPSGSFSKASLATILENANWSDATLFAGDIGRNSETAVMLETFMHKYNGITCLTGDTVDYFMSNAASVIERNDTLISVEFQQLQKLLSAHGVTQPITHSMGLVRLVDTLHEISSSTSACLMTMLDSTILVAFKGMVSTTKIDTDTVSLTRIATTATVWWMQQPLKPFEAVTQSLVD